VATRLLRSIFTDLRLHDLPQNEYTSFYERVGLNERELEILQVSVPKQHYYVVSKLGRRLVDLGVGKVALAWVGVNGREERQIVETVMDQFPETWRSHWLRLKGLPTWADYFNSIVRTL
jgi:type IV secretory pathway VirB4 component